MTCEETDLGRVIECDPMGQMAPQVRDALGWFDHEAAAVDPQTGYVYLTEDKSDGRLYRFRPHTYGQLGSGVTNPILTGVDNIAVSSRGHLYVCEDGGDMQICVIGPDGSMAPLLKVEGQGGSEVAGAAFSPDGSRMYFSSQRGTAGRDADGITCEMSGPVQSLYGSPAARAIATTNRVRQR